jgi:hypothetical protein
MWKKTKVMRISRQPFPVKIISELLAPLTDNPL